MGDPDSSSGRRIELAGPLLVWVAVAVPTWGLRSVIALVAGLDSGVGPVAYVWIAEHGYTPDYWLGWLPGYPLAIRSVHALGVDWISAASLVSTLGSLVAVVALWDWIAATGGNGRARAMGVLALLVSPAGFLLLGFAAQNEGLFLGFSVLACALFERRHTALAVAALTCATATRPAGLVVVAALVVRGLSRDGVITWAPGSKRLRSIVVRTDRFRVRQLAPVAGCAGFAAFVVYSGVVHGDPLAYMRVQSALTPSGPRYYPHVLVHAHMVIELPNMVRTPWKLIGSWLNLVMTLVAVAGVRPVARRYGTSYAVLVGGVLALIWFGAWYFPSVPRYLLAAFPLFALLGEWAGEGLPRRGWLVAGSALVMVSASVLYHGGLELTTW